MRVHWHLTDPDQVRLDQSGFTWGYFCRQPDPVVDRSLLKELKQACFEHDQPSLRLCLHATPEAELHEMLIVERPVSYFPPHKHRAKGETVQVLEGEMLAILFEEDGTVRQSLRLRPEETFLLRLSKDTYHLYLPLTEAVVYYESKLGPFDPADNLFAPWAPSRADLAGAEAYRRQLMDQLGLDSSSS